MKKAQKSLLEILLQIPGLELHTLPGLKSNVGFRTKDPKAKMLMGIWENAENKISNRKLKKPVTLSAKDVSDMEIAGYIKQHGSDIIVTSRGAEVIKLMVLEDDSHAFEDMPGHKFASTNSVEPKNWFRRYAFKNSFGN